MNKLEQAARQALGALVRSNHGFEENPDKWPCTIEDNEEAITALREALAEQAEQEPVLCVECGKPTMHMGNKCYACCQKDTKDLEDALKSWDAAPVRTKDLTKQEILKAQSTVFPDENYWENCARAAIAADREKNRA